MTIVIAVLIFGLIILLHELGHFIAAKLSGIGVCQFSIGFGPAIIKKKIKGTVYALRLLPLGGSVVLKNENGEEYDDEFSNVEGRDFYEASKLSRFFVIFSGAFVNFISGILIVLILLIPAQAIVTPKITGFADGFRYAGEDGLMEGDRIVSINGYHIYIYSDIGTALYLGDGGDFDFTVSRDGERIKLENINMKKELYSEDNPSTPIYGLFFGSEEINFFGKVKYAFSNAMSFLQSAVKSLEMLITGSVDKDEIMGTVGIAGEISDLAKTSTYSMWYFVAFLSVNLAFMNLLPIPGLDGGKLLFLLIEMIAGKRVPAKYEGICTLIGFGLIIMLFIFVTYNDILRLVRG